MSGEELYRGACAACHGADGRGAPQTTVGFNTPLPDFTSCSFATPEAAADWVAVVHEGGRVRAFDRRMPAFGELLSSSAIERVVDYVRSFCPSRNWPRGELNLPRALVTEKAFPENETVFTTRASRGDRAGVTSQFLYEHRYGAASQIEVAVPLEIRQNGPDGWQRGLGDIAVAFKQVLFHSLPRGTIVSGAAEIVLPTGKEQDGLGGGRTVFEPFVAFGQILPSDWFLQLQSGFELSTNRERGDHEAFWRTAVGKTLVRPRFGRSWTPMVELLGGRDLSPGEPVEWDVVPQMQLSLSRRQHTLVSAGFRLPVTHRSERRPEFLAYFLWDWFDGGLFEGWR
jgi:hypothetical protein